MEIVKEEEVDMEDTVCLEDYHRYTQDTVIFLSLNTLLTIFL